MKNIIKYLRFILPHLGIVLIVLAMILGHFYNWRGKAVVLTTDKTNVFITTNKEIKIAPFALTLLEFNVTHYDSGEPKSHEAVINVEQDSSYFNPKFNSGQNSITLSVNHPCKMAFGQDLYLISYHYLQPENAPCCVVELVHDPFQGVFLAGIILMMMGLILWLFTGKPFYPSGCNKKNIHK